MQTYVVACKNLEKEIYFSCNKLSLAPSFLWVDSGLHDIPASLHKAVQTIIDQQERPTRLLFTLGSCGGYLHQLDTKNCTCVIPRTDDCITFLLGSQEARLAQKGSYFFTEGWLHSSRSLREEYLRTIHRFGEEKANKIFHKLLGNYSRLILLDTHCYEKEPIQNEVRELAQKWGLAYGEVEGTTLWLEQLLLGPWDSNRFSLYSPHTIIP